MRTRVQGRVLAAFVVLAAAVGAPGDEIRVRFVERIGSTDTVLRDNEMGFAWGRTRIRVQLGVFDDSAGPAAGGGLLGWSDGSLDLNFFVGVRTPGRIAPFTEPAGGNGFPHEDPFLHLAEINGSRGTQVIVWGCDGGAPLPVPPAAVRGRNNFVSVYEVTIEPMLWCSLSVLTLEVRGEARTASGWEVSGAPVEPACPDTVGSVSYVPVGVEAEPFAATLSMIIGAPGWPEPECPADWNFDRTLDSSDFFSFLADFFEGAGDFTCDSFVTSEDFFAYLAAFFEGC